MTARPHVRALACAALAASFVLSSAAPAAAAGNVLIVDPAGVAGTYLGVNQAIAAASDGDTLLIRGGSYPTITLNGRSLTLLADGAAFGVGLLDIRNTTPSQRVVVRGAQVSGAFFSFQFPVAIGNCKGPVVLEDCLVAPFIGNPDLTDHAVAIGDSSRVTLVRCQIEAVAGTSGSSGLYGSQGGAGVYCEGSTVGIYDCEVKGGDGGNAWVQFFATLTSTFGGPGLWVRDGHVLASGSTFVAGQGGDGSETGVGLCDLPGSDGGDGITLFPSGQVTLLDCQTVAGAAGSEPGGCPAGGVPGVAIDTSPNGVVNVVNEPARRLEVTSPAREGQTATLTLGGAPNETTFLLYSAHLHGALEPGLAGLLLPGPPLGVFGVTPLSGGGFLQSTLSVPTGFFPPGIDAADVMLQVAVPGAAGTGVLGSGSVVTLLRSGF